MTNKRSNLSPEWSPDEEERIKKESSHREKEANDTVVIVSEEDFIDYTERASFISETDSDTDTSLDHDTPWKRTQKLSLMPDLDLEDSDNDDDLDYTEDLADQDLLLDSGIGSQISSVPDVEICFLVPSDKGFERKTLTDFPISFVKEVIRKFNGDYIKGLEKRRKYRKMIKEEGKNGMCVYRQLYPESMRLVYMDGKACSFCINLRKLCSTRAVGWW